MPIKIKKNQEKYASCNCCDGSANKPYLWDVEFTFRGHTQLVKLCAFHMNELKSEIDENF